MTNMSNMPSSSSSKNQQRYASRPAPPSLPLRSAPRSSISLITVLVNVVVGGVCFYLGNIIGLSSGIHHGSAGCEQALEDVTIDRDRLNKGESIKVCNVWQNLRVGRKYPVVDFMFKIVSTLSRMLRSHQLLPTCTVLTDEQTNFLADEQSYPKYGRQRYIMEFQTRSFIPFCRKTATRDLDFRQK